MLAPKRSHLNREILINVLKALAFVLLILYGHGPLRNHRSSSAVQLLRSCLLG
jgi:hypothetical protein